jgi:phage shock protein PspC (stress-responsive transcriptional regulator)
MKMEKWWPNPREDEPVTPNDPRRVGLYRSLDEPVLGGIFAGLAHKWGLNRIGLRIAAVLVALFSNIFSVFIVAAYVILWMILPNRKTRPQPETFKFD